MNIKTPDYNCPLCLGTGFANEIIDNHICNFCCGSGKISNTEIGVEGPKLTKINLPIFDLPYTRRSPEIYRDDFIKDLYNHILRLETRVKVLEEKVCWLEDDSFIDNWDTFKRRSRSVLGCKVV